MAGREREKAKGDSSPNFPVMRLFCKVPQGEGAAPCRISGKGIFSVGGEGIFDFFFFMGFTSFYYMKKRKK